MVYITYIHIPQIWLTFFVSWIRHFVVVTRQSHITLRHEPNLSMILKTFYCRFVMLFSFSSILIIMTLVFFNFVLSNYSLLNERASISFDFSIIPTIKLKLNFGDKYRSIFLYKKFLIYIGLLHMDFYPYINLTLHINFIYGFITYRFYIRIH